MTHLRLPRSLKKLLIALLETGHFQIAKAGSIQRANQHGGDPPNLTALISTVGQVPGFEENVLSKIKRQLWRSLCAYTHSGGLHLQRWQTDDAVEPNYAPDEIEEVLSFAETLGSIGTIAILGVTDQTVLANDVLEAFRGRRDAT